MLIINKTFSLSSRCRPPPQFGLNNNNQDKTEVPYETKLVGFTYLKIKIKNKNKYKGEKEEGAKTSV